MKIKKGKLSDKVDSYMMVQLTKNKPKKNGKCITVFNSCINQIQELILKVLNFFCEILIWKPVQTYRNVDSHTYKDRGVIGYNHSRRQTSVKSLKKINTIFKFKDCLFRNSDYGSVG